MEIKEMNLSDYCALNRLRFAIDPLKDAKWYFGNAKVQDSIMERLKTDVDIRGVPKFGITGRFGSGKTHTLFHLNYLFDDSAFQFKTFYLTIAPYSEDDPNTKGWGYLHRKILDSMGEKYLRELVRAADKKGETREQNLDDVLNEQFPFGDDNLKKSLSYVLSNFFLRESRTTSDAWNWLKGQGTCEGTIKKLETAPDMINMLLNVGTLSRWALGKPIVLLFDEAQALAEVKKASFTQIHYSFLQLAEPENQDLGFIIALFGTGANFLPAVIREPDDIISRLGVSMRNLHNAFIDLKDVVRQKEDSYEFMVQVLDNIIDEKKASDIISKYNLVSCQPCNVV